MHGYALFISLLPLTYGLTTRMTQAVAFSADPSIDAAGIFAAAKKAKGRVLANFPSGNKMGSNVKIFGDWEDLDGVSAIHFTADMDVDCDGIDFKCPSNPDGLPRTSFGHLDARKVPFYVIPANFFLKKKIKPNALGAIICNGKAFYGIFGDSNGDTPQVIGEASLLMAQKCFPDEDLDGGHGHHNLDVLYIVFGDQVPPGVGDRTIDISALKKLGDKELRKLAHALEI